MALSPWLGLRVVNGVTPILIEYNGLGVTALGNTFGTLDSGTGTADQPVNRAVYFVGGNVITSTGSAGAIYAAVGNSIYRSLDGGLSWVVATAIPSIVAGANVNKSGLNIVTGSDGTPYMCLIYLDSTATGIRGIRTTDGFTWISDGPFAPGGLSGGGYTQDTVFGNTLYCLSPSHVFYYEVGTGTIGAIARISASESLSRAAMCVWDNDIYIAGYNSSTGTRPLYKIDGGKLFQVKNLATSGTTATDTNKLGMFVDSSALYVFSLRVAGSTGWACYQVDAGTYTVTDITTTVIAGNMTGTGPGTDSRVLTFVDGNYAPGSNPPKYILYSANGTAGTAFQLFQWAGANSAMITLGTGGDVSHALTLSKTISNNGTYFMGGIYPYITSSAPTTSGTTGLRISFQLWGPTVNVQNTSIRLWFGGTNVEYPTQVGTLAAPASTSAPNGVLGPNNTSITGLTVDDGVSTYSFTWVPPPEITVNSRFSFSIEPFF